MAAENPIEVDNAVVNDSDFDAESVNDSTASITSSIFERSYFQGRAYANPKYGKHWAPNDEEQLEALDIIHHWLVLMLNNKLFLAPIGDNPQRILDVGTGTGIWAINVADEFPSASVIGTDIAPSQPSWIPPNVEFQIDDAQQEWTFEPESFDFIHIRYLQGTIDDWNKLYSQAYKALKPGGWIQHIEPDLQMRSDHPDIVVDEEHIFTRWANAFLKVGQTIGKEFDFSNGKLEKLAADAGFTGIKTETHKVPVGNWPKDKKLKELGTFILGWSAEEMQVFAAEMRRTLLNPKTRATGCVFSVYGQKPLAPSQATPVEEDN